MLKNFCQGLLLLGALTTAASAVAQSAPIYDSQPVTVDVAATVMVERAQIALPNGNRFWPVGGGINAAFTAWKGVGLAVDVSGEHASNIHNGVNLSKVSFMAGPRYTFPIAPFGESSRRDRRSRAFVEGLFGPTHAFDSLFPGPISLSTSANALSVKLGGGIDVPFTHGFALRAIEAGWIHSDYSNAAADIQNDFSLAWGISYRK
jgi:hypothetical protein